MLYYFKKAKNTTETQKKICAVYGEGAVTDWMCQTSFRKFHATDVSLDVSPWLDRSAEVDSDQIETITEENQCYSTWETANILKISKSIKLLVKMKNVSFILWKKLNRIFGQPSRQKEVILQGRHMYPRYTQKMNFT